MPAIGHRRRGSHILLEENLVARADHPLPADRAVFAVESHQKKLVIKVQRRRDAAQRGSDETPTLGVCEACFR